MATSVACQLGWGLSDGETIDSTGTRWSTVSRFDVAGGSSPLLTVPGIMLTGGNPLQVTQKGTPGAGVTVKAGSVVVPGNSGSVPPYGLTLTTNTDLDISATTTNPRIDLIIARVVNAGTSSSTGTIEVLQGTAAASPSRPTLPSGTSHCISLATVTIPASTSTITNAMISVAQSDTWTGATSDALFTAAPGGVVVQAGLIAMSATRRQAWAALFAPGTPWWDSSARVGGYTNGTDLVPVTVRTLFEQSDASVVFATSSTGVTSVNSGSLTIFGGNRRIRITARGHMTCDAASDSSWASQRAYLDGSGITGLLGSGTECQMRIWGHASNPGAFSRESFTVVKTFTTGNTTISVQLKILREGSGGGSPGANSYLDKGYLLVEDIGPA